MVFVSGGMTVEFMGIVTSFRKFSLEGPRRKVDKGFLAGVRSKPNVKVLDSKIKMMLVYNVSIVMAIMVLISVSY